jgi:hypothetical protein
MIVMTPEAGEPEIEAVKATLATTGVRTCSCCRAS